VEDEANLFAAGPQGVGHSLADKDLAQVADVDVAGGADPGDHHVRPLPEPFGDPLGPAEYGKRAHVGLHVYIRLSVRFR
jgi:hypothetical protein